MPRPKRIEYEGAYYHVMNRGRGRQTLFHDKQYFQAFLLGLEEAHRRFNVAVHGYCLMSNHYHLLLETPDANLGRVMRHVNGVYTQRYNRLNRTDGPLFRGRYKAILVDADAYLLQVSRYIHRNPIETKRPLVNKLEAYPWSSYPAYVNKCATPKWLACQMIYRMLGHRQRYEGYRRYVEAGIDEETLAFYNRGNVTSMVGDKDYRSWVFETLLPELEAEDRAVQVQPGMTLTQVVRGVAKHYGQASAHICAVRKGPDKGNEVRKVAMYLCQELASAKLMEIAKHFELTHPGSVSFITHQVRRELKSSSRLRKQVDAAIKSIMKQ